MMYSIFIGALCMAFGVLIGGGIVTVAIERAMEKYLNSDMSDNVPQSGAYSDNTE